MIIAGAVLASAVVAMVAASFHAASAMPAWQAAHHIKVAR